MAEEYCGPADDGSMRPPSLRRNKAGYRVGSPQIITYETDVVGARPPKNTGDIR